MQKLAKIKNKNHKKKTNITIVLHLYKTASLLLTALRKMY